MATIRLPPDFKEFLQLLSDHRVEYLLVGGYAVGYYGYPRATGDIDIWIAMRPNNAQRLVNVLQEFGFGTAGASMELFQQPNRVVRMGNPPLRIELLTTISGVDFADCYSQRVDVILDGVPVSITDLAHLRVNKQASGRSKNLNDLQHLIE